MPHIPDIRRHADHDPELIAAYACGDALGDELETATALVSGCAECAALHHDLRAIAAALPAMPAPARPRDFRLTPEQAGSLRPAGWRARLATFGSPRFSFAAPLGTALATLGLAVLLLGSAGTILPMGGATSAPEAAMGEAPGMPEAASGAAAADAGLSGEESAGPEASDGMVVLQGDRTATTAPSAAPAAAPTVEPAASADPFGAYLSGSTPTPRADDQATLVVETQAPSPWIVGGAVAVLAGVALLGLRLLGRRLRGAA